MIIPSLKTSIFRLSSSLLGLFLSICLLFITYGTDVFGIVICRIIEFTLLSIVFVSDIRISLMLKELKKK